MIQLDYVIRTVGERTQEVCVELVNRQKGKNERVTILQEPTHADAVDKTLKLGLQSEADWLVAIDADMLLFDDGISTIRSETKRYNKNVFVAFPPVYDKLYSIRRWGVTIYRVSMLEELDEMFQKVKSQHHLKIEGKAINEMAKGQKEIFFSKKVAALHDFYQYYKDLYRKAYLNAIRNPGNNKHARKNWERMAPVDADYLVMLKGMDDALLENRDLTNSINDFSGEELAEKIKTLGLTEKPSFHWDEYVTKCRQNPVEEMIYSNQKRSAFKDYFDDRSIVEKCKGAIVGWLPNLVLAPYRRIKASISKNAKETGHKT